MSAAFDLIVAVDWSAAARPKTGPDSVWWAAHRVGAGGAERLENPATRRAAMDALDGLCLAERAAGRRVLIGFDFPFGYPSGAAERFTGRSGWRALWAALAAEIEDGPANANNRFEVADRWNRRGFDGAGPFWGRPPRPTRAGPPERRPEGYGARYPAERRLAEQRIRSTQPVWKLFTAGSVGGQALMGIAALERFRRRPHWAGAVAVWPFETGFGPGRADVVFCEIYPSLWPPDPREVVKDAGQVRASAAHFAALDAAGRLLDAIGPPSDLNGAELGAVLDEEGWIAGLH